MYNFILQIFVMVSLGTIIFLVARTLPRITETATENIENKKKADWLKNFPWEKIDAVVNSFLEKTLRKTKLVLMKLDNFVSQQLNKFKKENGNNENNLLQP
jgi:hypothetical protein